jgi:tetratricopeptide (TPR) repeat protein
MWGAAMQKIIILSFLILTLICSCSKITENAEDLNNKVKLLWNGKQFTDPKKAIEYLDKIIKLKPDYVEAYNQRGVAHLNSGQNQPAIEDFTIAIRLQPDNALAYFNRGTIYSNLNQDKQAIDDFSEAIRLKPDTTAGVYNSRGIIYNKLGKYELAIKDFNESIKLQPNNAVAYNNRGISHFKQGDKNLCCSDVQKACSMGFCKASELFKSRGYCR